MSTEFITGMSAFVSSMLIFVGSAFLLLALIMGPKLAYFITASVTLGFTLIMGLVWSVNPLGPLGQLPEWDPIDAQTDAAALEFDAAAEYPEGGWRSANAEDAIQITQASELESAATEYAGAQISEGEIEGFPSVPQFTVADDATRLLVRGDTTYGLTLIDVLPPVVEPDYGIPTKAEQRETEEAQEEATGAEEIEPLGQVAVVAEYDPGNPLGLARQITIGTFILFVLHLIGLSMSERRSKRETAEAPA